MDQTLTSDFSAFPRICVGQTRPAPLVPDGFDLFAAEFEAATGWVLRFDENTASRERREIEPESIPVGKISICDMSASWPAGKNTTSRQLCDQLAERISHIFQDLQNSKLKLSQRAISPAENQLEKHQSPSAEAKTRRSENLGQLIQGLLESCVQLSGTDSAAVCLIDEQSKNLTAQYTHLNFKLQGQMRTLSTCPADLEALCGSAIVMSNSESVRVWQSPVDCKSAVCLPISSSTTLLGTLWVFGSDERDFEDSIVNVLEIIAGRIASELELVVAWRELLDRELVNVGTEAASKAVSVPETSNETLVQPPFDGWSVEATSGAELAKWIVSSDELIVALVANGIDSAQRAAIEVALESASDRSNCDVYELLDSIRELCGCEADGLSDVSCVAAVIDPLIGEVQLAQIGVCCEANLSRCDGEFQRIYRNHACFMTRGQSLRLSCGSGAESCLVFQRNT